jgi:hypothetical protein
MPRLAKPLYESLPALYLLAGVVLCALSYQYGNRWWSGPCAVLGILALIAGLAIAMHRRDYRSTSGAYLRRGRPVIDPPEDPR